MYMLHQEHCDLGCKSLRLSSPAWVCSLVVSVWVCTCVFVFASTCRRKHDRVFSLQPLEYSGYRSSGSRAGSRASSRANSARTSPVVSPPSADTLLPAPGFQLQQPTCTRCCVTTRLSNSQHLVYDSLYDRKNRHIIRSCLFWALLWARAGRLCRIWCANIIYSACRAEAGISWWACAAWSLQDVKILFYCLWAMN